MKNFKALALTALTALTLAAPGAQAGLRDQYNTQMGGDEAFVTQHVNQCEAILQTANVFQDVTGSGNHFRFAVDGTRIYRIELGNALLDVPSTAQTGMGRRVECKYEVHSALNQTYVVEAYGDWFDKENTIEAGELVSYSKDHKFGTLRRNVIGVKN